jgi:hypothetical protein
MNRAAITIPLAAILYAGFLLCAYPNPQSAGPQQPSKSQPKPAGTSMTGCVDEQDSHYVLVDDRNLTPIANLEADGFPTEAFAKHMGHKVTVRGTASSIGTIPLFKVRSIEALSDTCEPQPEL